MGGGICVGRNRIVRWDGSGESGGRRRRSLVEIGRVKVDALGREG